MSVWSSVYNKFKVRIFVVYLFINKNVCVKQDLEVSLFCFTNFTGKYLYRSLFIHKVVDCRPAACRGYSTGVFLLICEIFKVGLSPSKNIVLYTSMKAL